MRGNSGYSLECGRARTHIAVHSLVAGPGARRRCRGEPLSATEIVPREAFLLGQIGIFYNRAVRESSSSLELYGAERAERRWGELGELAH